MERFSNEVLALIGSTSLNIGWNFLFEPFLSFYFVRVAFHLLNIDVAEIHVCIYEN